MINQTLKSIFSGYYDLQKMRIQAGNRIVANFKLRTGQSTGTPESELDKEGKDILERVRKAYDSMADAAADLPRVSKFVGNEVISEYAELVLADSYMSLMAQEERYFKSIKGIVHKHPFWKHWLKGVSGVGELMALVILALIDIHKAKYPSSLWKYAGLDVGPDGAGRSRQKQHLEEKEYTNRDGELSTRVGITFNPVLKTKLLGVLGPSFLKAGNEKYAKIYYDYRNRLENHPKYKDGGTAPTKSSNGKKMPSAKSHRHDMATRYMVKMFLIDLYAAWREFEGLEVSKPYHEEKLGIVHSHSMLENQTQKASHSRVENHTETARQLDEENHSGIASQQCPEYQNGRASHASEENRSC
ncbi:hypothetical protein EHM92_00195 [bacterium]|nr:MAG: hypothetical protein EHM92_00195 [bacterium]